MKTKILLAAIALFSTINPQLSTCFAQGSLTPPGAPAPTMKSLAQIEPRTPISSVPFTISAPGSYYLTTNLTTTVSNAIAITASGVTLDLNGFTIASTVTNAANGGWAILLAGTASAGVSDIIIFNGHIRGGVTNNGSGTYSGSGFNGGIYFSTTAPVNVLIFRTTISGCLNYGIYLGNGDSTVVESCVVRSVGSYGIVASTVKSSIAVGCGNSAITGDQVSNCRGECDGSGNGVYATTADNCFGFNSGTGVGVSATAANNCYGYCNASGYGILATTANGCYGYSLNGSGVYSVSSAGNCYGYSNGNGFGVSSGNTAENCYGSSSGGYGVSTTAALNCSGYSNSSHGVSTGNAQNCYDTSTGGGYGVFAAYVASGCTGSSTSGTGLYAFIANVCHGTSNSGTALSTLHNVNS